MKLLWADHAREDHLFWQASDPATLKRINDLIRAVTGAPFTGIGKPEPLRGNLSGWWSRRMTGSHRLVYRVGGPGETQAVEILQCRWHYA